MYQANKRQGTASTKTRAEVSGGGRKPWPQKHTGRARAGSIRSPLWRHGGVVFGPKPRDYHYTIPKKKKRKALFVALSYKAKEGDILLLQDLKFDTIKTRLFYDMLVTLGLNDKKVLFVLDKMDKNIYLSGRNIPGVNFGLMPGINALDVLNSKVVVFTLPALDALESTYLKEKEPANA